MCVLAPSFAGNVGNLPLVLIGSLGDDPTLAGLGGAVLGMQYVILVGETHTHTHAHTHTHTHTRARVQTRAVRITKRFMRVCVCVRVCVRVCAVKLRWHLSASALSHSVTQTQRQ